MSVLNHAPVQSRAAQLRQVLAAVDGEIEPVRVTAGYRWATAMTACAIVLLPVIYAAMVIAAGFGVFWHVTTNFAAMRAWGPFGVLLWAAVLLFGVLLVFVMIKPLLAGRSEREKPKRLRRDAEPFLYDYVEKVCDAVHAPRPRSIRVSCDANASASFRRGLLSLFSNDLTLTIGLPLVAGLSLRQLTGVFAHEFGHFAQRGGMLASQLNFTVLRWLERIVYERDAWDWRLSVFYITGNGFTRALLLCVMAFIWLGRRGPWLVLMLGKLIAFHQARQAEFDADRYENRMAGTLIFESNVKRLIELQIGTLYAHMQLEAEVAENKLADDLPGLIVANLKNIREKDRKVVREILDKATSSVLSTHPTDRERIRSVRGEKTAGLFRLRGDVDDLPAAVIFRDFKTLCKAATIDLYRDGYGLEFKQRHLRSVEDIVQNFKVERESSEAVRRYFQVEIPGLYPLPIQKSATDAPEDAKVLRDEMRSARHRMLRLVSRYRKVIKRYEQAEVHYWESWFAKAALLDGMRVSRSLLDRIGTDEDEIFEEFDRTEAKFHHLASLLLEFEDAASTRLTSALQLLQEPRVFDRIENGEELALEMKRIIPDAIAVNELMDDLDDLRRYHGILNLLFSIQNRNRSDAALHDAIGYYLVSSFAHLADLQERMHQIAYPFENAAGDISLAEFALPQIPELGDYYSNFLVIGNLFEQLMSIQSRLFARVAAAAEKVEETFGLERLPEPPDDEDDDDEA